VNKSHVLWALGGLVVGVVAASKIRTLPLLGKLPSVG
jgi:hypothetical protein